MTGIDASKRLLESLPGFDGETQTEWLGFVHCLERSLLNPNLVGFALAALATEAAPKLQIEIIFDLFEFEVFRLLVIIATYSGDNPCKRITDEIPRVLSLAASLKRKLPGNQQDFVASHVESLQATSGSRLWLVPRVFEMPEAGQAQQQPTISTKQVKQLEKAREEVPQSRLSWNVSVLWPEREWRFFGATPHGTFPTGPEILNFADAISRFSDKDVAGAPGFVHAVIFAKLARGVPHLDILNELIPLAITGNVFGVLFPTIFRIPTFAHLKQPIITQLSANDSDADVAADLCRTFEMDVPAGVQDRVAFARAVRNCHFREAKQLKPGADFPCHSLLPGVEHDFFTDLPTAAAAVHTWKEGWTEGSVIAFDSESISSRCAGGSSKKQKTERPAQEPGSQPELEEGKVRLVQIAANGDVCGGRPGRAFAIDLECVITEDVSVMLLDLCTKFGTVLVFGETDAGDAKRFLGLGGGNVERIKFIDIQAKYGEVRSRQGWKFIGLKPSLAHVCREVLGLPLDKSLQCGWMGELTPEQKAYALLDSYVLVQLWEKMKEAELY